MAKAIGPCKICYVRHQNGLLGEQSAPWQCNAPDQALQKVGQLVN